MVKFGTSRVSKKVTLMCYKNTDSTKQEVAQGGPDQIRAME